MHTPSNAWMRSFSPSRTRTLTRNVSPGSRPLRSPPVITSYSIHYTKLYDALEGIEEPMRVHEVVQPSGVRSRLDRATRLSPFVGREQELGSYNFV